MRRIVAPRLLYRGWLDRFQLPFKQIASPSGVVCVLDIVVVRSVNYGEGIIR